MLQCSKNVLEIETKAGGENKERENDSGSELSGRRWGVCSAKASPFLSRIIYGA